MASTLADQVSYYVALLALQYRTKSRATQNIAIYVKQVLADMLVYQLQNCFDVDTAVGQQLDIIGKYVGVPRASGSPIPKPYFGFTLYGGSSTPNVNGFRSYSNLGLNAQGIFLQYGSAALQYTDLPDTAYALLIKLKIFLNSNDARLSSIQYYLRTYLTGLVTLVDNMDMTLTYTVTASLPPSITYNVLMPYLPKPMGVGVNLILFTVQIYLGSVPITTLNKTVFSSTTNVTVTSDVVSAATANGLAPLSYQWTYVSGDIGVGLATSLGSPFAYWTALVGLNTTRSAVWYVTATDQHGLIAVSQLITINLTHSAPL